MDVPPAESTVEVKTSCELQPSASVSLKQETEDTVKTDTASQAASQATPSSSRYSQVHVQALG